MNHFVFIAGSYLVTAAVLIALVGWLFLSGRSVTRRLAELDARGIRRRSVAAVPAARQ